MSDWRIQILKEIESVRDPREKAQCEVIESYTNIADKYVSRPNPLHSDQNTRADTLKYAELAAENVKLRQAAKALKIKLQNSIDEQAVRTRTIAMLQDEILTYHLQLNMADEKISSLTKENAQLINRWMERVARETEKLNDANAFIER
ncbi:autophagy protein 16-domain-containing protein [Lipomyces oligophaga]|uniref:autophagy protein 16-domain-containing protein n=1 Tax=Lipomyces oligophaga TaxID=45792 RepID=UPI0034CF7E1F